MSVFAGTDGDGIADVDDPYPTVPLLAPYIYSPYEGEEIFDANREVTFSGSAEVGSGVDIFDEDDVSAPICSATTSGDGLSLGRATGDEYNSLPLINSDVQDQFFYDTTQDTATVQSSGWRTLATASWFTETKDDEVDGVCDFQVGDGDGDLRSGADDRCEYGYFPEKALILATTTDVYIFDAHGQTFWKKFQFPNVTTVHAFNGKVYVGTSSSIEILDFSADDFTQDISLSGVGGIDTVNIGGTTYVLGVGDSQVLIRNELSGADVIKNITDGVTGSLLSDSRVMFSTATSSEVSDLTVDALANDFSTQTIHPSVGVDNGVVNVMTQNFVGTTAGLARIFVQAGGAFVQFITDETFTLPARGDVRGNFTGFLEGAEIKNFVAGGANLENVNSVDIAAVSGNPELYRMQFNGTDNYVRSDDPGFSVSGNQLTVGLWVRRPTVGGTGPYKKILVHGRPSPVAGDSMDTLNYWISAGDNFFDYPIAEDPYFFGVRTGNGQRAAQLDTLEMDTWQFLVGTYDGTEIRFYLNGEIPTGDDSLPIVPHAGNLTDEVWTEELRIGAGFDWEYFDGAIALPFVSATTYTPEQVQFLYDLSLPWFTDNTVRTLAGTGSNVLDVTWDDIREEAAIATETTITDFNSDGSASQLLATTGLKNIARTYIAPWSCSHQFATSGIYTVFGRAIWNTADTLSETLGRTFSVFPTDNDTDGDGLNNDVDNDPNVPILNPTIYAPAEGSTQYHSLITFSGRAEADTDVYVFMRTSSGDEFVCSAHVGPEIANLEGDWSCDGPDPFPDGDYTVFARAYVGTNASNRDSADRRFTVFTENPNAPVLLSLPEYLNTNTYPIMWIDPNDPLMNVYWAEMDTSSAFNSGNEQNSTWTHASSWDVDNLVEGNTYYFRVKTRSLEEVESIWSDLESTTIDLTPPVVGEVVQGAGRYSTSETISFSWNATPFTDALSGITYFQVRVESDVPVECGGSGGDSIYTSASETGDQLVATEITELVGIDGESYTACVRAVDAAGNASDWVKSMPTTVDTTGPESFALTALDSPSSNTAQVLQWEPASDQGSGIVEYEILVQEVVGALPTVTDPWVSLATVDPASCAPDGCTFVHTGLISGNGYRYKVVATNKAGLATESSNFADVLIDTPLESLPAVVTSSHYTNTDTVDLEWQSAFNTGFTVTEHHISRDESALGSGAILSFSDTDAKTTGVVYNYLIQGSDGLGALDGFTETFPVLVDKVAPLTTLNVSPAAVNGSTPGIAEVSFEAVDPGAELFEPFSDATYTNAYSGISEIRYQINGSPEQVYAGESIWFSTEGSYTIDFYAVDRAGNVETLQSEIVDVDFSAPTVTLVPDNFDPAVLDGFFAEDSLLFHIVADDGTGSGVDVRKVFVRFDENGDGFLTGNDFDFAAKEITVPDGSMQTFTFDTDGGGDGRYDFYAEVVDMAGNITTTPWLTAKVDREAPIVRDDIQETMLEPFTVHLDAYDQGVVNVGIDTVFFTTDDSDPKTSPTVQTGTRIQSDEFVPGEIDSSGFFTVKYYTVDELGNESDVWTARYGTLTESEADCSGVPGDGMPDWWEDRYAVLDSTSCDAEADTDGDGLSNADEFANFTDPTVADTDGDGVNDGDEVLDGTSPLNAVDHQFTLLAPQAATASPFQLVGTATPYATMSYNTISSTVDPSGTFVLPVEITSTSGVVLTFLHPRTSTTVGGVSQTLTIDPAAQNPKILNFDITTELYTDRRSVEILALPNADLWVFELREGAAFVIGDGQSDASGNADIEVSFSDGSEGFFVFDATNYLTSTLMKLAPEVFITGRITSTSGEPIHTASALFTADDGRQYSVSTDINGNFTLSVPAQTSFNGRFWQQFYQQAERTVSLLDESIYLAIQLEPLDDPNYVQTEDGLVYVGTTGEHKTLAWSGREREESVTRLTMAQSREQIAKMNEGFKGSARTIISETGKQVFGGYLPGRISTWQFTTERVPVLRMTAFSEQEQRDYLSAATPGGCLELKDSVMDFRDVPRSSPYFEDLLKIRNLGFLAPGEDNNIRPDDVMAWDEALVMLMQRSCIEVDTLKTLRFDGLPSMEHVRLSSEQLSKTFYTALKSGLIASDFDPGVEMTRAEAVKLLLRGFGLEVNEAATNSSFVDITSSDEIAPYLVLARKLGMFQNFSSSKFKPDQPITRAEFASFFVGLFETETDDTVTTNVGYSAALQNLDTARRRNIDYVAAVKRKQEVNEIKQEKLVEKLADQKPGWKATRQSDRAPMWRKDNTENIRQDATLAIPR